MTAPSTPEPRGDAPDSGWVAYIKRGTVLGRPTVVREVRDESGGRVCTARTDEECRILAAAPRLAAEVEALRAERDKAVDALHPHGGIPDGDLPSYVAALRAEVEAERRRSFAYSEMIGEAMNALPGVAAERLDDETVAIHGLVRTCKVVADQLATLRARTAALAGALEGLCGSPLFWAFKDASNPPVTVRIENRTGGATGIGPNTLAEAVRLLTAARQALRDHGGKP